jgi:hypothetical protein
MGEHSQKRFECDFCDVNTVLGWNEEPQGWYEVTVNIRRFGYNGLKANKLVMCHQCHGDLPDQSTVGLVRRIKAVFGLGAKAPK